MVYWAGPANADTHDQSTRTASYKGCTNKAKPSVLNGTSEWQQLGIEVWLLT